jgi:leucyl aminopeptidase (aminopeptidase T)
MDQYFYEFELGKAADILCRELFKLKEGECLVITADTESDMRVVNATARAAFSCGAKPLVLINAAPLGVSKEADKDLPLEALTAVLKSADAWVEYNNKWLLYSTPYEIALQENKKLRHLALAGMNVDMMVRCIGRVNYPILRKFQEKIAELTGRAHHVRMTTPAGTNVEFDNYPDQKIVLELGYADTPGSHMMSGQIGWMPRLETVNGTIVFDGSTNPPLGLLKEPVFLTIKNGEIVKLEGGWEAKEYERWLKSFNHPQMLKLAHIDYGFNPGARLSGNCVEDERVWGATEWGIGYIGQFFVPEGVDAPSHSDGICLNSSVWLDERQIMRQGEVLEPELKKLAKELRK